MARIKTASGFEADINEQIFDDMEILDLIADLEDGKVRAYRRLSDKLFRPEEKARLYDHLRTEDGRVPVSAMQAEMEEIFAQVEKAKK